MFIARPTTRIRLECLWKVSGNELVCTWVERPGSSASSQRPPEAAADPRRKVA
jgi:hypothetical protein